MKYDFSQLSSADFEDLCRDLIGKENDMRFEAFGPGPDGGMDGRHAKDGSTTVLQAKHYHGSSFSRLLSAMKKERHKIDILAPNRYILVTSQSLNHTKKNKLASAIGHHLKGIADILGCSELNSLLRKYPDIEKTHIKLWLSSTVVLEHILHAGLEEFTQTTKHELVAKLKTYVTNPSLEQARKLLHKHHVLIISGYAGVGKTTLAEILTYEFLAENWNFYAIRSLDEGFAKIDDKTPTVFLFDDFLGRVDLNMQSLKQHDSALAKFVDRVRRSPNARFILTTREHIFREAGLISDYVDDEKIQLAKYILDVGSYTRRVKSHILFNHLAASNLGNEHFESLLGNKYLPKIIDHPNYNPRLIATVSSESIDLAILPEKYPDFVIEALNRPEKIWEKPFNSLDKKCQHLLYVLFFSSEYDEEIDNLRSQFEKTHKVLSQEYTLETSPKDFETSLKILESGFVKISGQKVSYVNPALRDYLKVYLADPYLLKHLPKCAVTSYWASSLWKYAKTILNNNMTELRKFTELFYDFSNQIHLHPANKKSGKYSWSTRCDLVLADRIKLLMEWWRLSKSPVFEKAIIRLCEEDSFKLYDWGYGTDLPILIWEFHEDYNDDFPSSNIVIDSLSRKLAEFLDSGVSTEDLVSIKEDVSFYLDSGYSEDVGIALDESIKREFDNVKQIIDDFSSETELEDHIEYLKKLNEDTGHNIDSAINIVNNKIQEITEDLSEPTEPDNSLQRSEDSETFSDTAINSLFSTLLN